MKLTADLSRIESKLMSAHRDERLYFWLPRGELAFLQSIVESTDNLARIRTEQNTDDRAKVVLMFPSSQKKDVLFLLKAYEQESANSVEFAF